MYQNKKRKHYVRPGQALRFRSVESMLIDDRLDLPKQSVILPAAGKIRPFAFGTFNEATSEHDAVQDVVCSGAVLLLGAVSDGGYYLGITDHDAAAGERVSCFTEGKFYLPLDWAGDSGATPARVAASSKGSLAGKPAYWLKDLGMITDQVPDGAGEDYLHVGEFYEDSSELKPDGIQHGDVWAAVSVRMADAVANAVTVPTEAAIAHTGAYSIFVEPSSYIGLTADLFITALNTDPNIEINSQDISTVIAGGSAVVGDAISYTGTAGAKTVAVTVGGTTMNFTLTLSASAAPTLVRA